MSNGRFSPEAVIDQRRPVDGPDSRVGTVAREIIDLGDVGLAERPAIIRQVEIADAVSPRTARFVQSPGMRRRHRLVRRGIDPDPRIEVARDLIFCEGRPGPYTQSRH